MSWHKGQNGLSWKAEKTMLQPPRRTFHSSTTSLCQSAPSQTAPAPLKKKLRGAEVANPGKKEKLTAFSTVGWLFRNNLAGECWLCLGSADSCRAWLPFFSVSGINDSTSTVFCCAQQFSQDYHQRDIFVHLRDRAFFFFCVSYSFPGAQCAKQSVHHSTAGQRCKCAVPCKSNKVQSLESRWMDFNQWWKVTNYVYSSYCFEYFFV